MPAAATVGWRGFPAHNRGLINPVLIVTAVLILFARLPSVGESAVRILRRVIDSPPNRIPPAS